MLSIGPVAFQKQEKKRSTSPLFYLHSHARHVRDPLSQIMREGKIVAVARTSEQRCVRRNRDDGQIDSEEEKRMRTRQVTQNEEISAAPIS